MIMEGFDIINRARFHIISFFFPLSVVCGWIFCQFFVCVSVSVCCSRVIELSFVPSERKGSSIRYACRDILVDCRRLLARHVCYGNMRVLKMIDMILPTDGHRHGHTHENRTAFLSGINNWIISNWLMRSCFKAHEWNWRGMILCWGCTPWIGD